MQFFTDLPTLFFFGPLQETNNFFFKPKRVANPAPGLQLVKVLQYSIGYAIAPLVSLQSAADGVQPS